MKNANPRYTSRRLRRGGGERKSTKKYFTMKQSLKLEWSPHERRIGANELIAAGHTCSCKDDPCIRLWIKIDERRRSKRSGKKRRDYLPTALPFRHTNSSDSDN